MNKSPLRLALIGDYNRQVTAHQAIPLALQQAAETLNLDVRFDWLRTDTLKSTAQLQAFDGFWAVPATPYWQPDGALLAIRYAREQQRPFLGTCGGFQHALLEYARNVLGWSDAEHGESCPHATQALLTPLSCALVDTTDRIQLVAGSRIAEAYTALEIHEGYHCRYGINPTFENALLSTTLRATGRDANGDLRSVELDDQAFFLATLFQPERAALQGTPPPLVIALLKACQEHLA